MFNPMHVRERTKSTLEILQLVWWQSISQSTMYKHLVKLAVDSKNQSIGRANPDEYSFKIKIY